MGRIVSKEEVLQKIQDLKDYIRQNVVIKEQMVIDGTLTPVGYTMDDLLKVFDSLESKVNWYYTVPYKDDLEEALTDAVSGMYCDLVRRETKYEIQFDLGLKDNFPNGFHDLSLVFYDFQGLFNIDGNAFIDGYNYVTGGTEETTKEATTDANESSSTGDKVTVNGNRYIEEWIADIEQAPKNEVTKADRLYKWCLSSGRRAYLIYLFEDMGKILSFIEKEEIARIIYIDRGLKAVIESRNLDIYIPSYIK